MSTGGGRSRSLTPSILTPSIPTLPNFREVGGRLRGGLLYRSVELGGLDDQGLADVAGLGLRTVFDLRTSAERLAAPDRVPAGVELVAIDVLAGAEAGTGAGTRARGDLALLMGDPALAARELGAERSLELYRRGYRQLVSSAGARAGFGRLYAELGRPGRRPALVHCASGKDRTGWAVAALQLLLGVPDEQVLAEYLRSNAELLAAAGPMIEAFAAAGGDRQVLRDIVGVREDYLGAAVDEVAVRYGSIEEYFTTGLGLGDATLESLRTTLVREPQHAAVRGP